MSDGWTTSAHVFGTLGAVCWSIQLLPQIWKNYRGKSTLGLQPSMMLLWALAGIPLGVYNIVQVFPVALQIQPQILTFLSLLTWTQCYYYVKGTGRPRRGVIWCVASLTILSCLFGGVEAGIVFAIQAGVKVRTDANIQYWWPILLMGVLAGVLLCLGVLRHYVDIYKQRTVRGISFLFCGIDALGDLTSLISVVLWFQAGESLDILGVCVYASEFIMWAGIFACGIHYNLRAWLRRRRWRQHTHSIIPVESIEERVGGLDSQSSKSRRSSLTAFQSAPKEHCRDGSFDLPDPAATRRISIPSTQN